MKITTHVCNFTKRTQEDRRNVIKPTSTPPMMPCTRASVDHRRENAKTEQAGRERRSDCPTVVWFKAMGLVAEGRRRRALLREKLF
jgi:hypothetical protein